MTFSTGGQFGQTKLLELSFSIRKTFFYMVKPGGENLPGALPLIKPLTVCVCITVPLRYTLTAQTRFIRTYAYEYTHIRVCLYAHMRMFIRTYAYVYTHIRACLYAYTRICIRAYTHIHASLICLCYSGRKRVFVFHCCERERV